MKKISLRSINWDYKKIAALIICAMLLIIIPLFLLFISSNHSVSAFNLSADLAVGQADLVSSSPNASGSGANPFGYDNQSGVVSDGTHLFVSDFNNSRVLIYNTIPALSSKSADLVIGQQNMYSGSANQGATPSAFTLNHPRFLATDGTKLFVADTFNNRVLIYNTIPVGNNVSADIVIGQPDMASNSANQGNATPAANTLFHPWSVSFDSNTGELFITDTGNNRVLIYNIVPTANNASADVVVGQPDVNTLTVGGGITDQLFSSPSAARVIQDQLFVSDTQNNRVLGFNPVPTTDFAAANFVIGQPDMSSGSPNQGGSTANNTLSLPTDINWDGTRLLIQDSGNNRILAFNPIPTSDNASANDAIGQIDLTSRSIGTTSATFNNPQGELDFSTSTLFVGDSSNNRVLAFNNFGPSPTPTNTPTPTPTFAPASAPVCSDTKPGDPSSVTAASGPGSGQITLSWTAPANPVTDYSITYSDNSTTPKWGVVSTGKVTSYVISALSNGVAYYFWVNAVNGCMPGDPIGPASLGSGPVSSSSGATTTSVANVLNGTGSGKLVGVSPLPPTGPQDLVKFGSVGVIFIILGAALLLAL
ncbi:MAG TPA: fibronectin type III domain-containing protein [Candidatus Sulfotelmatobacter sp.]|nr:fibronectin type III domain-containing protein [Candidatus Sulfotelmatobacter sp.]